MLEDLSATGARLYSQKALGAWGDTVILCLHRGTGLAERLELPGTVVRTEQIATGHTLGVRFDALASGERARLEALISRLSKS
jgi:hypothetical protein